MSFDGFERASAALSSWDSALREQREAEYDLLAAHRCGDRRRQLELWPVVRALRMRADLLLAEAVRVRCACRDGHSRDWHPS